MTQKRRHIMASAAAVIALTFGMLHTTVQAQASKAPHGPAQSSGASAPSMPAGGMGMKAMMKENNDKMAAMSMTGKPDVDFAMMMRIHHQGAIQMSEAELKDGKDAEMKKMARQGHPVDKMKK